MPKAFCGIVAALVVLSFGVARAQAAPDNGSGAYATGHYRFKLSA